MRRLGTPRPPPCASAPTACPRTSAGRRSRPIGEEWVVEDRWWTGRPLRRRYFELVLADGRNATVFRDLRGGHWFTQVG